MLHDLAPAKINLFLHVLGRRDDGYHLLESLVGFADIGDALTLEPGPPLSLAVSGPFAAGLSGDDNLILRAARGFVASYPGRAAGRFRLEKNLPVASGIGGGSTDAAAALRLLARAAGIPLDDPPLLAVARALGADVPVCLEARPRLMRGIGHDLGPALRAGAIPAVLVNPGVAVPTPAVFAALGLAPGARHAPPPVRTVFTEDAVAELAATTRNDLEGPALTLAPAIGDALAALRAASGCRLARMSGSGATVFGLFADAGAAEAALAAIRARHPGWWVRPCRITLPLGAGTRPAGMEVSA